MNTDFYVHILKGHVPGEQFIVGEHRGKATRNATKYMTYRV